MRIKFVYSCSIKIHALGFEKLLESIFCFLLVVEVFSLQKVVEKLEEVVAVWLLEVDSGQLKAITEADSLRTIREVVKELNFNHSTTFGI